MTDLSFHYHYFPDRREWIGVVLDQTSQTVITLACEETRDAILRWWETYLASDGRIELDMYDRARSRMQ